jgi:hypothetical protein
MTLPMTTTPEVKPEVLPKAKVKPVLKTPRKRHRKTRLVTRRDIEKRLTSLGPKFTKRALLRSLNYAHGYIGRVDFFLAELAGEGLISIVGTGKRGDPVIIDVYASVREKDSGSE